LRETRLIVTIAFLTGVFCVVFAFVVSEVFRYVGAVPVAVISFASGFLGSLFAQAVVRPWQRRRRQGRGGV
jgi:positive regulator of sigma E activity